MIECTLRNVMVVGRCVLHQSGFQFGAAGESALFDDLGDAAVEALDHAVGLRMPGRTQAMLDDQRGTRDRKSVV